ncbi:DUF72 domain-containing protein [Kaistella antarctica]|uniref:Histidine kinase n=1 Tax=Kaistella antarctica TaxID=266748 RepID=A0A448NP90_9FLAO|nr:DUF72 domain-containing protein [Kaistella antarctica]KEY19530.1 histidine kinase [Kaistella antarctica]SEW08020.1 Uncharacterized conserved protein YecE, DUF72 family [Kaistella antarctica]VEH97220.1 Protein of uncharacterised function DUF72 [Kaistella antarctica]
MNKQPFIGCSGFAVGFWKGLFYPENLPSKDYLNFYSKHLNAVEINSTFYRRPRPSTILKWVEETEANFKFFIKIPKTITHLKKLDDTKNETTEFCQYLAENLGTKLAGFLFQLPPSFHYTVENLAKIIATVDKNYLNVVEFRHQSWWNIEVQNSLNENNIVFAGVSIPKDIPTDFIINNDDFAYYRLHGNPEMFKSEYAETELKKLAAEILKFKGTSFIFFNNTYGTAAIKNALYLNMII